MNESNVKLGKKVWDSLKEKDKALPKAKRLEIRYKYTDLWVIEGHRGLWCECSFPVGNSTELVEWTSTGDLILAGASIQTSEVKYGTFFKRCREAEASLQNGVDFSLSEEHNRDQNADISRTMSEIRRHEIEQEIEQKQRNQRNQAKKYSKVLKYRGIRLPEFIGVKNYPESDRVPRKYG